MRSIACRVTLVLLATIIGAWVLNVCIEGLELWVSIFFGLLCGFEVMMIHVYIVDKIERHEKGIPLFADRSLSPEQAKEKLLLLLQWGDNGLKNTINSIDEIFHAYPDYELTKWEPFKAWYKHQIDEALANPSFYTITKPNGDPYCKEEDNLYDPDAPDWALFDREHYDDDDYIDDDDDDDDNDDDDLDYGNKKRKKVSDSIAFGLGVGMGLGIGSSGGD